jgi:hypothetical protein
MCDAELLLCVDSAAVCIVDVWSSADALVDTAVGLMGVVTGEASMPGKTMDMDKTSNESPPGAKTERHVLRVQTIT